MKNNLDGRGGTQRRAISKWVGVCAVCLVLLLSGCRSDRTAQPLTVTVQQVISGRELEISGMEGHPEITERVLLAGIDAPDIAQAPWGTLAKQSLEPLAQGKTVQVEVGAEPRTEQGIRLAYVWQGDTLLNETLVEQGYAIAQPAPTSHKYDQRLAHAQDQARLLGLGIWNPKQPMRQTPAEFRDRPKTITQP